MKAIHKHIWTEESGLVAMLILLVISNFIINPFFGKGQLLYISIRVIWLALLFAGISTLSKTRFYRRLFSIIPVLLVIINVLSLFRVSLILQYADIVVDIAAFGLLAGMVFVRVFEHGPITIHRLIGAIVGYMLIGNLWADIYQFLFLHVPGSIQAADATKPAVFIYFSYTTLTTTGYGDILPALPITRSLAIIEQLIGVFYPAILIGRLVSLSIGNNNHD
jgi:hypothetical protein